jgi:hypothetical protein
MRKTAMYLLALLATLVVATPVAAADPSKSVSISATRAVVVYGQNVTLTGQISTQQSGQKVDVLAKPFGLSTMSALSTVETSATGQWEFLTKPTIETTYQARWTSESSPALTVKVRPMITLAVVRFHGRVGTFTTSAIAAREFAGDSVLVQRMTSFGPITLKRLTLNGDSTAKFNLRFRHHVRTNIRVVMPRLQAAPGYIAGFSRVLSVRR